MGAAADALRVAYDVPLATIGLLTTALFAAQLVATVPAGRLIDRFGAQPVALVALLASAAGNALLLAGPWIGLALAARAIVGLGVGLGFLAGTRIVGAAGGGVVAQGVYGGVGLGGGGVAIVAVPALVDAAGWRRPWIGGLVAGVPALIALALLARHAAGGRASRSSTDGGARAAAAAVTLAELLHDRRLRRLCVVHAASFGFAVVLANWTAPLLLRAGAPRGVAGAIGGVVLLAGIVGRPGGGVLVRRTPADEPRLLSGSLLVCAAGAALLAAVPGLLPVAAVGALAAGLAAGLPFGPVLAAAAAARPEAAGTAVAIVNTAAVAAIVAATPLLGLTFALPGDGRLGIALLAAAAGAAALVTRLRAAASGCRGT